MFKDIFSMLPPVAVMLDEAFPLPYLKHDKASLLYIHLPSHLSQLADLNIH